ncbi:hypothetical protein CPHO_04900 [Corynebacterium phocae]|uniref:Ribosome maturation factor RimP n=1 Tax=Corynebacterium phocae TaxID=161895 RepID=A0A1L7D2N7_9CORY|nr:ribosome maturation factor RimP [Corynebacterium phocae]APT92337.1 hypothetical protein CPHO_04900 [Corynebacterium phocae]KAA8724928.1 ribosome maturation factor RimP [Corynebacterium phocae]
MAFPTAEILTNRLAPLAASHGLDIEDVKATPAGKKSQVVIRLDGDTRPSSDTLEVMTQEISEFFDELEDKGELNFGAGYTLEVSTPGVDLPLTLPRHFRRNRGRLINKDGQIYRLGALSDDEQSVIVVPRTKKSGKKDVPVQVARIDNLTGAVVEIEFAKPPESETQAAALHFEEAAQQAIRED